MDPIETLQILGTAAALGLLVGLQREHAGAGLAGIRTFPLIAVLGVVCALLALTYGSWLLGAGLLTVGAMLVTGNLRRGNEAPDGGGITTEISVLLVFLLGAYLVQGRTEVAVVVAGALAVLLHLKAPMHDFVRRIAPEDIRAVMQFVVISLVILPLLPDQAYGPYQVLNPRNVWMMVVLIVGVQLASYVLYRMVGQSTGTILGGVVGGLVSSTATTVAYARRAKEVPAAAPLAAAVIMIASTVSLVRVLAVAAVVAPLAIRGLVWPLGTLLVVPALLSLVQFAVVGRKQVELPTTGNPAELKPALFFAGVYALVTLGIATARDHLGEQGLYLVAIASGLTDMDAITLSTTRMLTHNQLEIDIAWRVILVAALANLVFKGGAAWILGGAALGRRIVLLFGAAMVAGLCLLLLWPASASPAVAPGVEPAPPAAAPAPVSDPVQPQP
jgi:uncharacterized membrane protein (DUF4010 family)